MKNLFEQSSTEVAKPTVELNSDRNVTVATEVPSVPVVRQLKGVYISGEVGTGKTMFL